jgi:hypothetical protein
MEKSYLEVGIVVGHVRLAVRLPRWRLSNKWRSLAGRRPANGGQNRSLEELYRRYQATWAKKKKSKPPGSGAAPTTTTGTDWVSDFHRRYNPVPARPQTAARSSSTWKETLDRRHGDGNQSSSPSRLEDILTPPDFTSTPVNLRIRPLNCDSRRPFSTPAAPQSPRPRQSRPPKQEHEKRKQEQQSWVPVNSFDMSGVKIYENVAELDYSRQAVTMEEFSRRSLNESHVAGRKQEELLRGELNATCRDAEELANGGVHNTSCPHDERRSSRLNSGWLEEEEQLMHLLSCSLLDDSYEIVSVADQRVVARAHFRPRSLKFPH